MQIKYLDEKLPPEFSDIELNSRKSLEKKIYQGVEYTLLGTSSQILSMPNRILTAICSIARIMFSLGFSEKGRTD